jgi:hypothetical protein
LQYSYSTTAGSISGSGATATLDTSGLPTSTVTITATTTDARNLESHCTATVQVEVVTGTAPPPPPPPPILDTGRDFLVAGDPAEKPGYGLYSYLLWWSAPPDNDRARFRNIVSAFLGQIQNIGVENGTTLVKNSQGNLVPSPESKPIKNLNIAYIPTTEPPPDNCRSFPPADTCADWVITHYDTQRSKALLMQLERYTHKQYRTGPYIISTLHPLSAGLPSPPLFQNLSASYMSKDLAIAWIRAFQNQAMSQQFWKADAMQTFALNLRSTVETAAATIQPAILGVQTFKGWIAMLKAPASSSSSH